MKLICNRCFNYTYFIVDVEYLRKLNIQEGNLVVKDAYFEDWNYSDTAFRNCLEDLIGYVIKSDTDALSYNSDHKVYENNIIHCANRKSKEVSIPYCAVYPERHLSLEDELHKNKNEYKQFRREKHGAYLPVLWRA